MPTPATTSDARSRPRLSRALLIEGCLKIADAEGTEAVTLRRLGTELGVDPTAVYRHFRDKQELLAATADHVLLTAASESVRTGDWKADIRSVSLRIRQAYLDHPGLAWFVATANEPLPNEAVLSESGLAVFRSAGFSDDHAVAAFELVEAYTLGISAMDAATTSNTSDSWRRSYAALPRDEFPHLSQTAHLLYRDPDARFAHGLDLLLDAIERDLSAA